MTGTPAAPAAPKNLRSQSLYRKIMLGWESADDVTITVYQIRYRANGAWDPDWTDIEGSDSATNGTIVPDLTNGVEYTIEVRAKAGAVAGASSGVTGTPVPYGRRATWMGRRETRRCCLRCCCRGMIHDIASSDTTTHTAIERGIPSTYRDGSGMLLGSIARPNTMRCSPQEPVDRCIHVIRAFPSGARATRRGA